MSSGLDVCSNSTQTSKGPSTLVPNPLTADNVNIRCTEAQLGHTKLSTQIVTENNNVTEAKQGHSNASFECNSPYCVVTCNTVMKFKCGSCDVSYHTQCTRNLVCNITISGGSIIELTCEQCVNGSSGRDVPLNSLLDRPEPNTSHIGPSLDSTSNFAAMCTQFFTAIQPQMRSLIIDVFNKDVTPIMNNTIKSSIDKGLDNIDHVVASNTDNIARINEQVEEIYKKLKDGRLHTTASPLQNQNEILDKLVSRLKDLAEHVTWSYITYLKHPETTLQPGINMTLRLPLGP